MTKLEELKVAYEAEPYGLSPADKDMMEPRLIRFYNAAHNLMPRLIEAVELCRASLHALETPGDFSDEEMSDLMSDLARVGYEPEEDDDQT